MIQAEMQKPGFLSGIPGFSLAVNLSLVIPNLIGNPGFLRITLDSRFRGNDTVFYL
jgi:hypothetical protein